MFPVRDYVRESWDGEVGHQLLAGLGQEEREADGGGRVEGTRRLDLVGQVEKGLSLVVVAAVGEKESQGFGWL